jgi:hypothetical protein
MKILLHHKENLFLSGLKMMLNPHPEHHEPYAEVASCYTVSQQNP